MFRKISKAHVIAVDMGYGHWRAALPFADLTGGEGILAADNYSGIPSYDKHLWEQSRVFYEFVSRFKKFPVLGNFVFALFDKFQSIEEFYPKTHHLEGPTFQLKQVYRLMRKKSWGEHFIDQLNANPLPLITTFFIPAFMAEYWGYAGPIYLVIPDTDVSRAWAPLHPSKSRITYLASTRQVALRLARYGVRKEHIIYTGFPLPYELLGEKKKKAKTILRRRLAHLDPENVWRHKYALLVKQYLGVLPKERARNAPTLMFAIGGAGAQEDLAVHVMRGLAPRIKKKSLKLIVVAGIHEKLAKFLEKLAKELQIKTGENKALHILSAKTKEEYFISFGKAIQETDILWTKPSELCFYSALGLPIIIAPPIGSQEIFNREWLLDVGAGVDQKDPKYVDQWLPDMIQEGVLARAAMQGYVEVPKDGAENISRFVTG